MDYLGKYEIIDLSDKVKIRRNFTNAILIAFIPCILIIYTCGSSLSYIKNKAIFSTFIVLNLVLITLAGITLMFTLQKKIWSLVSFFVLAFCILPIVFVTLTNSDSSSISSSLTFHQFAKSIFYSFNSQYLAGWISLLIFFFPIVFFFSKWMKKVTKNKELFNEFMLRKNLRSVKYTTFFNKQKSTKTWFFIFYIISGITVVLLFLFGVICIAFVVVAGYMSGETFIRYLINTHRRVIKASRSLLLKGKSYITIDLFEVLKRDSRPPILWLRSFKDDDIVIDTSYGVKFEERIVEQLKYFGPVIAIGSPYEKLPSIGAAREYFKNDDWQNVIDKLIKGSGFIVALLGNSKGLEIEYNKIRESQKEDNLIIIMPPVDKKELQNRWKLFTEIFALDKKNEIKNLIDERLLLIKLFKGEVESLIFCSDKKKDAYQIAFSNILIKNTEKENLNKRVYINKAEFEYAIGKDPVPEKGTVAENLYEEINNRRVEIQIPQKTKEQIENEIQKQLQYKKEENNYNKKLNLITRILLTILFAIILFRIIQELFK